MLHLKLLYITGIAFEHCKHMTYSYQYYKTETLVHYILTNQYLNSNGDPVFYFAHYFKNIVISSPRTVNARNLVTFLI